MYSVEHSNSFPLYIAYRVIYCIYIPFIFFDTHTHLFEIPISYISQRSLEEYVIPPGRVAPPYKTTWAYQDMAWPEYRAAIDLTLDTGQVYPGGDQVDPGKLPDNNPPARAFHYYRLLCPADRLSL